jgi:hypothetical protein
MAAVAQACGVPSEALLLEPKSHTTVENLSLAVSLLARQNLLDTTRTVHLVSCPWHMRRVLHLASVAFGPGIRLLASPHEEGCTESTWASSVECRKRVLAEFRLVRSLLHRQ